MSETDFQELQEMRAPGASQKFCLVTDLEKEHMEEGGIVRKFGMIMYILLYLKWITNKDLLYTTWNSAQHYVAAGMEVGFGGEWIYVWDTCVCMVEFFPVHLELPQNC